MMKIANRLNDLWNRNILLFHDTSVRINVRWLVRLSVWAHRRLTWNLPDEWKLVDGMPLNEYRLLHELKTARHQIRYFADYASELQNQILEITHPKHTTRRRKRAEVRETPR